MPKTRLCNDHSLKIGIKLPGEASFFSFIFLHFLIGQTLSKDDNSKDEWLEPLLPRRRRPLGKGSGGKLRGSMFFTQLFTAVTILLSNLGFEPFESP